MPQETAGRISLMEFALSGMVGISGRHGNVCAMEVCVPFLAKPHTEWSDLFQTTRAIFNFHGVGALAVNRIEEICRIPILCLPYDRLGRNMFRGCMDFYK
jgi:hypothetical protein